MRGGAGCASRCGSDRPVHAQRTEASLELPIGELVAFIEAHRAWAGVLLALISFGESLILIGFLFPGTPLLIVIGGLATAGLLHPVPVLAGAIIGAVAGDAVAYWFGKWLGREVANRPFLVRHRGAVAQARLFFRRYGFAAVFLGRFFGPIRSTVPLVAGMLRMEERRFQAANILSALVWAPAGFLIGWAGAGSVAKFLNLSDAQWLVLSIAIIVLPIVAAAVGVHAFQRSNRSRRARRAA